MRLPLSEIVQMDLTLPVLMSVQSARELTLLKSFLKELGLLESLTIADVTDTVIENIETWQLTATMDLPHVFMISLRGVPPDMEWVKREARRRVWL